MTEERIKLFLQMALAAVISITVVAQFSPGLISDTDAEDSETESFLNDRLNGQQLQVRPSFGQPAPLDSPLQSPRGQTDQNARSELQTPQQDLQQPNANQDLQPNAGIDSLPEGFDI